MRTKKNKDGTRKVWLTRDELEQFCNYPDEEDERRKRVAFQLMGLVGMRVGAVPGISYSSVKRTSDGDDFLLEIDGAKDTTGEYQNGKQRDVFLPSEVEREMFEYVHRRDLDEDDRLVAVSKRMVSNWIEDAREELAEVTGEERWGYVSAHDLRRSLVTYLIHEEGVQLSIVQNQMGWDDISTVKRYLDAPSESVIQSEFADVW